MAELERHMKYNWQDMREKWVVKYLSISPRTTF
jgi:hypothetical protein